jgi:hypothetical protein
MFPFKSALLAATLMASAIGLAAAQTAPTYDPAQLPAIKGKVAQYTLTPRGDVDGLILADGTEVHVNPHLSSQLIFSIRPGDAVTIHGLKARALPMIAAASITNDATGVTVTGMGVRGRGNGETQLTDTGKIKEVLHDPRGAVNGVLMEDGTVVRLPPPEARRLADELAVGKPLSVRGDGVASPLGRVVMARQIGPDASKLVEIWAPRPRSGPMMGGGRAGMPGHGRDGGPDHPMPGRDGGPPPPPPAQ